jgi:hypothetical protein
LIPPNSNKFLVKEALQAFNDYNHKKQKEKLVKYWQSKRRLPERNINWRYRNAKMIRNGTTIREGNDEGKTKRGRPPYAEVHKVRSYVEGSGHGKTIATKEVCDMLEKLQSKRNNEQGIFHIANQPRKKAKNNYKILAAVVTNTTLTIKAVDKTRVREISEKSF